MRHPRVVLVLILVAGFLVAAGIVLFAVGLSEVKHASQTTQRVTQTIQQQRRQSSGLTCSIDSAIAEAGRQTILGAGAPEPPKVEALLEHLGAPPLVQRQAAALAGANAYASAISAAVARAIGGPAARKIVTSTGSLNCKQLAQFVAPRAK